MTTDVQTILKLSVPVIVRVGESSASMREVLALSPGAILDLGKPADKDLDLLVNNKAIASGQAVKVGERFGIRVKSIGSPAQRVAAMGQSES